DDLFAGFQAGLDLEPIAAVHAQGERAAMHDVAAVLDAERVCLAGAQHDVTHGNHRHLRVRLDDDRPAAVHARVELAGAVVQLDLRVQRPRSGIAGGRQPNDLAGEPPARQGVDLDVRVLADADPGQLMLVDGDEDAQRVDARDRDDRAAPRWAHQRPRIEPSLYDDAGERRGDARLPEPDRQRRDLRLRRLLGRLGGRELALRLLQLLLGHDGLGGQLL